MKHRFFFKRILTISLTLCLLAGSILSATGCTSQTADAKTEDSKNAAADKTTVTASTTSSDGSTEAFDTSFHARDLETGYEESAAVVITCEKDSVQIDGNGAAADGSCVTITQAGTYILTGKLSDGRIVVSAGEEDDIRLIFKNLELHCSDFAPLFIEQADHVVITLEENSKNSLSDGDSYATDENTENVDGVIFSRSDLAINGSGSLTITANYKHGIVSKDDLVITGGDYHITANGKGLSGKDCVKIADGTFSLDTQGSAIASTNSEEETRGYLYLRDGTFTIKTAADGLHAENSILIDGGTLHIEADDDGIHAEELLTIANADICIPTCYEGLEAHTITIESGSIELHAEDDGLNAASPNSASSDSQRSNTKMDASGQATAGEDAAEGSMSRPEKIQPEGSTDGTDNSSYGRPDNMHPENAADGTDNSSYGRPDNMPPEALTDGTDNSSYGRPDNMPPKNATDGTDNSSYSRPDNMHPENATDGTDNTDTQGMMRGGMRGGMGGGMETDDSCTIEIHGGTLHIYADGDGIDSNGSLTITGGTIYVDGPEGSGNGSLDYGSTATISGGTLLAAGSAGMAQGLSEDSSQCSILYTLEGTQSAGTTVTLMDKAGKTLLTYTPTCRFQCLILSCPELVQGETYTLRVGNTDTALTLQSVVTSNFSGGFGGQKDHGGFKAAPDADTGSFDTAPDSGKRRSGGATPGSDSGSGLDMNEQDAARL